MVARPSPSPSPPQRPHPRPPPSTLHTNLHLFPFDKRSKFHPLSHPSSQCPYLTTPPPPPRKTLVKGKVDLLPLNTWGPAAVLGQEPPILLIINNYQAPPPSTGAYAAASSPPPPNPSLFPISRPRSSRAEEKTCSKNVYGCVDVRPRCHCLQRVTCVREA